MSFIKISDVYATIHKVIREDKVIRELMGFDENTTLVTMAQRIQKRRLPKDVIEGSKLPLITFYKLPGRREFDNHLSYLTIFDFDIYTNNDVELAIDISDRISELFEDTYLPLKKGSSFKSQYVTSAEDVTDMKDIYKYYTQIAFNFSLEG